MSDDVYDVEDLKGLLGGAREHLDSRGVLVGVALAVIGVCLALALLPHVFGAVGAEPIDTGIGPTPDQSGENAQQRYQNYLTSFLFTFAPVVMPALAAIVAFAAGLRERTDHSIASAGTIALGAAIGMAIGYTAFVLVGHLAYGEAPEGFYVESVPVAVRPGVTVVNAIALAAVTGVASAVTAFAGALLASESGRQRGTAAAERAGAADTGDQARDRPLGSESDDGSQDGTPDAGDDGEHAESDGERTDSDGERAQSESDRDGSSDEREGSAAREEAGANEASGPASSYRETGPVRGSTPQFDPNERDWDGRDDDRD